MDPDFWNFSSQLKVRMESLDQRTMSIDKVTIRIIYVAGVM